jgi:hypothetical protein
MMHHLQNLIRSSSASRLRVFGTLLVLGICATHAAGADPATGRLRAGAATSNITPPLGVSIAGSMSDHRVTHIHDELHARALVLDNGVHRLALVTVDSCMIPREIFDAAKLTVQEKTGIPASHVLMAATHAHSAATATPVFQSKPDADYQRFLTVRIADAVRRAHNQLEPARIGWGVGAEPNQVFNRRWHMQPGGLRPDPFGNTTDQVRMNPPRADPNLIEPAGPIDPAVSVISVQSADGRPIALLGNYSLHYVGGVGGGHASADYFGMFADRITELIDADRQDPPFVGMLSNGTSGDINNINFRVPGERRKPYEQMRIVAEAVAREAHRVYGKIDYTDRVVLDARVADIQLGVRRPGPEEVSRAKEILAQVEGPVLRSLEEIYAGETVALSRYPATVDVVLQAVRIGDLGICAIPCEVFVEIGLELRSLSPLQPMFTIELANGYNGYLPTADHHKLGGYETWRAKSSYLEVDAASKIVKTLGGLLDDLK